MPNIRPVNPALRRKSSGLLDGLLGALYATGTAEENPNYFKKPEDVPFTDSSYDANTVQPFQGRGLFGGIRASGLNNQVSLGKISQLIEEEAKGRELGKQGSALQRLVPGFSQVEQQGMSPLVSAMAGADPETIARLVSAYGGGKFTSGGLASLPAVREESQMIPFGSGGQRNLLTGDVFTPERPVTEHELVPIIKDLPDMSGNMVPTTVGYKDVSSTKILPAGTRKLVDYNKVSQDEFDAVGSGSSTSYNNIVGGMVSPKGNDNIPFTSTTAERPAPALSGHDNFRTTAKEVANFIGKNAETAPYNPLPKVLSPIGKQFSEAGQGIASDYNAMIGDPIAELLSKGLLQSSGFGGETGEALPLPLQMLLRKRAQSKKYTMPAPKASISPYGTRY